ncbi:MAG TPA: acyltransferase family protein [Ignavibacteriales bacterium]|nr:acyltransferase family protein [Ignavibacteriales bacterium]
MERNISVDIARGIVITGMAAGHIISWLPVSDSYYVYAKFIYIYQIPFFFLISGFHIKLAEEKPFKTFFKKRFNGIMAPFIIMALVTSVFKTAFSAEHLQPMETAKIFIAPLFFHGNFTGSWFLPCFFWAQLIAVLCLIYFKKRRNFAIAVFTIGLLGLLLPITLPEAIFNNIHKYHNIDTAIAAAGLIGIGFLVKDKINYESAPLAFISAVLIYISFSYNGQVDMYYSRYNYIPLFLSGAAAGSYLVLYISKKIERSSRIIKSALAYAGKNSLWILVLHGSFGFALNYLLGQNINTPVSSGAYVLYMIVLVGGPLLSVYLYAAAKMYIKSKWSGIRADA